jgi:hypothetical protein
MIKKLLYSTLMISGAFTLFLASCVKQDFDEPPPITIPVGEIVSLTELRAMFTGQSIKFETGTVSSTFAIVVGDETSGNIYRNSYVQDTAVGINLRLNNPGGLYQGDSIRIFLEGLILSDFNGTLQLDSVDVDKNVIKIETGVHVEPKTVTIPELATNAYNSQLIKLENVEFKNPNNTWSDPVGLTSQNRWLMDQAGNEVIVRTSGYANFAGLPLPTGNGTFIAIAGKYNNDIQLYVRDVSEIDLSGNRYNLLVEDFASDLGSFKAHSVFGNQVWTWATYGNGCALISGYENGSRFENEDWLVSPEISLENQESVFMMFREAINYSTIISNMTVWVSSDYDGTSLPTVSGNWENLQFNIRAAGTSFNFIDTDEVSLDDYIGETIHIAFKYISTTTVAATWEIGEVRIRGGN